MTTAASRFPARPTVRNIALAWVLTLPVAAAIAWLAASRFAAAA